MKTGTRTQVPVPMATQAPVPATISLGVFNELMWALEDLVEK